MGEVGWGREPTRIADLLREWLSLALFIVHGTCATVKGAGFLGRS